MATPKSSDARPQSAPASPLRVLLAASDMIVPAIGGLTTRIPRAVHVHRVTAATCVEQTLRQRPDAVVVDGRLAAGIRLVQELRTQAPNIPVLFVAATLEAITAAMCAGATDFVMPGASAAEALLRLQFLTTAAGRPLATTRMIGALCLDRDARTLSAGNRSVSLTPIEFKLFERLLLQPGIPVARADLERSIWRQDELEEHPTNIAVVYVSYLRRKLAKLGGCSIRTITNVGYALHLEPVERRVAAPRRRTS